MMITFAFTGFSGQIGTNFLSEIILQNINDLSRLKMIIFGRRNDKFGLRERIKRHLQHETWRYFLKEKNEDKIEEILASIQPIEFSLEKDGLNISEQDYSYLKENPIDYFVHIAALTDFRFKKKVIDNLENINIKGTQRIIALIDSLPYRIGKIGFVSSAYVCGKTYGRIDPEYANLNQDFRNPYEITKLKSELCFQKYCKDKRLDYYIFRPSTVGGRSNQNPIGLVTKVDVYLGWLKYFIYLKAKLLKRQNNWDEIYSTPVDLPIRIHANEKIGLNIVSSDNCAKMMYHSMIGGHHASHYHLACKVDVPVREMFTSMLSEFNIDGYTYVNDKIESPRNEYEKQYYEKVGLIYTPYIIHDQSMSFDTRSAEKMLDRENINLNHVDSVAKVDLMVAYAKKINFGLSLERI